MDRQRNAAILVLALFALWQMVYWAVGDIALSSPLDTLRYTAKLRPRDDFSMHVFDTGRAFAIAFALSVLIGLPVGILARLSPLSGDALEPMIVAVYAVPKLTLYPILLLAFGLGLSAKVAFGVLHGVIPIILFTLGACGTPSPSCSGPARVQAFALGRWCDGLFLRRYRKSSPACASVSRSR